MLRLSTGLRAATADTDSVREALTGGKIHIYNGVAPATADQAVPSSVTKLVTISFEGSATGLTLEADGDAVTKPASDSWYGTVTNAGVASWYRFVAPGDDGTESTTQARIQGDVAVTGASLNFGSIGFQVGQVKRLGQFRIRQGDFLEQPVVYRLTGSEVTPVDTDTTAEVEAVMAAEWPNAIYHMVDASYSIISSAQLQQLVTESGYTYGTWVEELRDCDEFAGILWGWFQTVQPGNIAIGMASLTYTEAAIPAAHVALLCVCSDGLFWVENDGNVYEHAVDGLPGKNTNLDVRWVVM